MGGSLEKVWLAVVPKTKEETFVKMQDYMLENSWGLSPSPIRS